MNKYWVYVNASSKGNYRRESEAIQRAKSLITNTNEVVVIELRFKQELRLHVWVNGEQIVKSGKPVK